MPEPSSQDSSIWSHRLLTVELEKRPSGLGFNIVGGINSQHIPGDSGIFVTKIKSEGAAHHDGRLREGDRIVSVNLYPHADHAKKSDNFKVNGISLFGVSHEQAVAIFRNCKGRVKLEVEVDAERKILHQPSKNLLENRSPTKASTSAELSTAPTVSNVKVTRTPSSPTKAILTTRHLIGETSVDTPRSGMSAAVSASSLVDDTISQTSTPKRSPQQKSNEISNNRKHSATNISSRPGFYQEIAYTAVGVAVLAGVGYFVYRKFTKE